MVFTRRHLTTPNVSDTFDLNLNGIKINRTHEARFLGVLLDDKLTWSKHINSLKSKMARYLGILYRIKSYVPIKVRLQLYHSFVQSHLNFCSLVWGFASKSLIESLFTKQKQGIRAIMPGNINYHYNNGKLPTHTKQFFHDFGVLTIHNIIFKNALLLLHKKRHFHNSLPPPIRQIFPDNTPDFNTDHVINKDWLTDYNNINYRNSVFFKGPLAYITQENLSIITPSSILSLNIYKKSVNSLLLEHQNTGTHDEWPIPMLNSLSGLRSSQRSH